MRAFPVSLQICLQRHNAALRTPPGRCAHRTQAGNGDTQDGPRDASSWAEGLRPAVQAEWLCDCYRLRVHDDAHYGAGYLHGPSHPAATPTSVLQDFFVFCKLAVANRLVPRDWQWGVFLQHASEALPYAFDKDDAREKYGSENVFAAMMGGRSLRFTGRVVYGCGAEEMRTTPQEQQMSMLAEDLITMLATPNHPEVQDVGGTDAWIHLLRDLKTEMERMEDALDEHEAARAEFMALMRLAAIGAMLAEEHGYGYHGRGRGGQGGQGKQKRKKKAKQNKPKKK